MDFLGRLFTADTEEADGNPAISIDEGKAPGRRKRRTYHDYDCLERIREFLKYHWRGCLVLSAPILLSPVLTTGYSKAEYVYILCVIFWVTECLPVMVTSLLPIVLLPMFGIMGSDDACRSYFKDTTMVCMGGNILALCVEYSNLHHRLALCAIKCFTCYPRALHAVVMLTTYLLSNVISNTATAALMCPIVKAILEIINEEGVMSIYEVMRKKDSTDDRRPNSFATAFYLGTAYSATIGGVGSLIGTGTNLAFRHEWTRLYPKVLEKKSVIKDEVRIEYLDFLCYCLPISFLLLCSTYLYLQVYLMGLWRPHSFLAKEIMRCNERAKLKQATFKEMYQNQHKITCHQASVLILVIVLLLLYFTRSPDFMTGWEQFVHQTPDVRDALPTSFIVFLIFILPSSYTFFNYCCSNKPLPKKSIPCLLTWKYITDHMPWSLLFVVGGSFAIETANRTTKVVHKFAEGLLGIRAIDKPVPRLIFEIVTLSIFLSAFGSNVSIVDQLFEFLAEVCFSTRIHPLILFYPAVLACSVAFHLPVSTPPNAIACRYGNISTKDIIFAGIGPTIAAIILLELFCWQWVYIIYSKYGLDEFPSWAEEYTCDGLEHPC